MTESTISAALLRRKHPLIDPPPAADKEAWGRALVVAGAADVPGATLLSGEAALRGGAGKVTLATPKSLVGAIGVAFPEARVVALPRSASGFAALLDGHAVGLIGPGMTRIAARTATAAALASREPVPLVLDAAAIGGLWGRAASVRRRAAVAPLILTPHAGEMADLCGRPKESIVDDPVAAASAAAQRLGAIVVLKGATTIVATPDRKLFKHDKAIPGLATAGSGDVLAGLIAGLVARSGDALAGALWGAYLHARAGQALGRVSGATGFLARELPAVAARLVDGLR